MSIKHKDEPDPEEAVGARTPILSSPRAPPTGPLQVAAVSKAVARPSVAVVGAGLAGLMAARVLCQYGVKVNVFEAYKEVGGRVRSNTGFSRARITEEGAELIGSFHNKWLG